MDFDNQLKKLINEYLTGRNCGICCSANVLAFYSTLTLDAAIKYTCEYGQVKVGNTYYPDSHFEKLNLVALQEAAKKLWNISTKLQGAHSFKEVYYLVRAVTEPIKGLNRMFYYDASVRIAASVGKGTPAFLPEDVFYQRGAELGAIRLGILSKATIDEEKPYLPYKLFIRASNQFNRLKPYQIEDFLCIFYDKLDFAK
jgi:hypothetical protein